MIYISVKRKTAGIIGTVLVLGLLALNGYTAASARNTSNKYEALLSYSERFDSTSLVGYFTASDTQSANTGNIEVFDIAKGEVISREPMTMDIQNEVINAVKSIESLYTKVSPIPSIGYVVRIPFDKEVAIENKYLNGAGIKDVSQVFFIIQDKEPPILLVLDIKARPFFFVFKASLEPLIEYLQLKPVG